MTLSFSPQHTPTELCVKRHIAMVCLLATSSLLPFAAHAKTLTAQWSYQITVTKEAQGTDAMSKAIITAAKWMGSVGIGAGADRLEIDSKGFALQSNVKGSTLITAVSDNVNMSRRSRGIFVNGLPLVLNYADKRGSSPELSTVANLSAKRYEFYKGGKLSSTAPFAYVAVDIASLPYVFLGKPAPTKPTFVAFTDGKSLRSTTLSPSPATSMKIAGGEYSVVRYSGAAAGGSYVSLWVRATDGYPVKMVVGLGSKYGAVIEQSIAAIPAETFSY
jgi:hypothetical protein